MKADLLSAILKTIVAASVAPVVLKEVPLKTLALTHDITTPYIGVPFNVVIACAIGTYASFAWGESVSPRAHALRLGFSCFFVGCAVTALANAALDTWTTMELKDGTQAGLGALCSVIMRFAMPEFIKRIGPWMDKIPFLRKKED